MTIEARQRERAAIRTFQRARIISPSARRRVRAARTGRLAAGATLVAVRRRVHASGVAGALSSLLSEAKDPTEGGLS
jgi:hypothetical protein